MATIRLATLILAWTASAGCSSNSTNSPTIPDSGLPTPDGGVSGADGSAMGIDANTGADSTVDGAVATADADNGAPSTTYPAPHPALPTVEKRGGSVLGTPKVVPVFFGGDDATTTAQIEDFLTRLGASDYWKQVATTDYGVGPIAKSPTVQLTETAPTTTDNVAIAAWLTAKLNGNDPAFPAPDAETIFALVYPTTTTFSSGGVMSCKEPVGIGGYHENVALDAAHGSTLVQFAVVAQCASFHGLGGIDRVTKTLSHELVEAATDPLRLGGGGSGPGGGPPGGAPGMPPAYSGPDAAHFYWGLALGGGEVADLCQWGDDSVVKLTDPPFLVQRSWSNSSAAAGHDPCVPAPAGAYFGAATILPDDIDLGGIMVKGARIAVGASKTIDVILFSDGDTNGPFMVEAHDAADLVGGTPHLGFALDRASGVNGEKLHLTITVSSATNGAPGMPFFLLSTQGTRTTRWVGVVGQ